MNKPVAGAATGGVGTSSPGAGNKEEIAPIGAWIRRLADDERQRDGARARATEAATQKADLVRAHAPRLLDELRTTVVRDLEAYRDEFPGDTTREIIFEAVEPEGGFAVRKPSFPTAALSVSPHLSTASVTCEYRFTPSNGLPSREDRLEFTFTSGGDVLRIKHNGTGQVFMNADTLSEYLLVPVLTGRPR